MPADGGFAGRRIELIFPQQFIGKGEGVARKFKRPPAGFTRVVLANVINSLAEEVSRAVTT